MVMQTEAVAKKTPEGIPSEDQDYWALWLRVECNEHMQLSLCEFG